jgi:Taurine catabolism dioxygenase TauD, TfdA family
MDIETMKETVANQGYCHVKKGNQTLVDNVVIGLGKTLYLTDIVEKDNGRLLNSSHEMFMHTDQPTAHYILWHCLQSAEIGGETMILPIESVFNSLPEKHQNSLKEIQLRLNFEGGDETYPFFKDGNFFYSPSLLLQGYTTNQQLAILAFKTALQLAKTTDIKLETDDFFILDNTKYLHGRKAFENQSKRHLKRYLIKDLSREI